jgi:dTDP-4-dehydrorhamnose 3,5-epimerase
MGRAMTAIEGVRITRLAVIDGAQGSVLHALRSDAGEFAGFGEVYFSTVAQGAVKGWKLHARMVCNFVVPVGAVRFVIHDDREGSATRGASTEVLLSRADYRRLTLPPGVWFAFQGVGEGLNLILNVASIPHDPTEVKSLPVGDPAAPRHVF